MVVQKGESLDGFAIGVGRPGQSGTSRGGKGGTGAVIKGGGKINGVVIGIGGQGGNAGSTDSNLKKNKGEKGIDQTFIKICPFHLTTILNS